MKIIELRAQNVKNLKAIEITANGKTVILSGKNEVGKSSVIDAIAMALTGQMVERPIKEGETRAEVEINLGDYIVKRVWTATGNRLEVVSKDGARYPSPQTLLDKIIGKLSFDPLEFKDMEKGAQRNLLVRLVGLDFTELEVERKRLYDNRTLQNRILSGVEARFTVAQKPIEGLPGEEISLAEEIQKIEQLEDKRQAFITAKQNKERIEGTVSLERNNIIQIKEDALKHRLELQKKIDELNQAIKNSCDEEQVEIKTWEDKIVVNEEALKNLTLPSEISREDVDRARLALKEIEAKNIAIRSARTYVVLKQETEEARAKSEEFTKKIEELDQQKAAKIQEAQYPVSGLSVSEDSVIFNGIPFSQASDGVKIRVSTAIAMKLNPNLKVILIKEASLLDSESLKSIIDTAKENDYQLWIERVSDAGQIEIHIED